MNDTANERPKRLTPTDVLSAPELPDPLFLGGPVPGTLSMLIAESGIGKSFEALTWAASVATGKTIQPSFAPLRAGPVLVLSYEDSPGVIRHRLDAIAATFPDIKDALWQAYGEDHLQFFVMPEPLFQAGKQGLIESRPVFKQLEQTVKDVRPALVVIDPLSGAALLREENSNSELGVVAGRLADLARCTDCAILLVHHTSKTGARDRSQHASRGASALPCSARWIGQLAPAQEGKTVLADSLRLTVVKNSYHMPCDPVELVRAEDGVLIERPSYVTNPAPLTEEIGKWLKDNPDAQVTPGGLKQWKGDGAQLRSALDNGLMQYTSQEIEAAVNYGLKNGLLRLERVARRSNRQRIDVLRPVPCSGAET